MQTVSNDRLQLYSQINPHMDNRHAPRDAGHPKPDIREAIARMEHINRVIEKSEMMTNNPGHLLY